VESAESVIRVLAPLMLVPGDQQDLQKRYFRLFLPQQAASLRFLTNLIENQGNVDCKIEIP
jgi:hypothetical protein